MDYLLFIPGVALLTLAIVDALWTVLWVDGGGGPLSSRMASALQRGLRLLAERSGAKLGLSGPIVLVAILVSWVVLLWGGWTLVFSSDPDAIAYEGGARPGWAGRAYFAGYTLFTLGIGNVVPEGGGWEVVTALASASGMVIITLAVSYVLAVLGSVVGARAFAMSVTGLGTSPDAFVRAGWTGSGYGGLTLPLNSLSSSLDVLSQQHLAYPILHYYRSREDVASAAYAVAVLDEALTVLRFGVPEEYRPPAAVLEGARASVSSYLNTLEDAFVDDADQAPPPPDLGPLRAAGLPTVAASAFAEQVARLDHRRRRLFGVVQADARPWPWREGGGQEGEGGANA